ncbi:unnamed protein product [Urochloa humidicola]
MSPQSPPTKAGHGVDEQERGSGTGTTPVKVVRGAGSSSEQRVSGTSPVRVRRGAEEAAEERATGTSPVKVASRAEKKERATAAAPVNVKAEPGALMINLTVHCQTAADAFFRVRRDVKLRRLIDMYCGKHSLDPKVVKFLGPDGRLIRGEQTPDEVGLEDGDDIDLFLYQNGGAGTRSPAREAEF